MKREAALLLILAFVLTSGSFAGTGTGKVAILYNGNNQVNRDALHFMSRQFQDLKAKYQFEAVGDARDIKPGNYKAILVLNTGMSSGVDPQLAAFIGSWRDKAEIILISLHKGSTDVTVDFFSADKTAEGVDTVSAATFWKRPGLASLFGGSSDVMAMHEQWVKKVLELLDRRN